MQDVIHALQEGFPFSYINCAVLALSIAIISERAVYLVSKYKVNTPEFMKQITKLVQAGNLDRAIKLCDAEPLPLLEVVKAGLTQANRGEDAIISSIEEKMSEVVPLLEKRVGSLWTLANLATLIGLLGTIRGLIRAFQAVGQIQDPMEKQSLLASGIAEAMWNTFLGLMIAVVCMGAHLVLHGMVKRNRTELERATMQLENLLTVRRQPTS